MSTETEISELLELDRTHWLHPQGDLDAMAGLWNVNVGYGRAELADSAAAQMRDLAFHSAYNGFGHAPGIRLAARLAELAPGDLEVTFFASGGAEANDTAYKLARLYWKLKGEPG